MAVWAVSGLGYCVSVVVSPANSQLAGVLVVLINLMLNGVFVTHTRMGQIGQQLMAGSYAYHVSADQSGPALLSDLQCRPSSLSHLLH
eukprot:COSAG01_NODE_3852_length_5629_cov_3.080108_10_plen_88_part_00